MKCNKCNRETKGAEAYYCESCGSVFCPGCTGDLCDCLSDLKYFS